MDPQPVSKPIYKSLYFQVITAIIIDVLLGHFLDNETASEADAPEEVLDATVVRMPVTNSA